MSIQDSTLTVSIADCATGAPGAGAAGSEDGTVASGIGGGGAVPFETEGVLDMDVDAVPRSLLPSFLRRSISAIRSTMRLIAFSFSSSCCRRAVTAASLSVPLEGEPCLLRFGSGGDRRDDASVGALVDAAVPVMELVAAVVRSLLLSRCPSRSSSSSSPSSSVSEMSITILTGSSAIKARPRRPFIRLFVLSRTVGSCSNSVAVGRRGAFPDDGSRKREVDAAERDEVPVPDEVDANGPSGGTSTSSSVWSSDSRRS